MVVIDRFHCIECCSIYQVYLTGITAWSPKGYLISPWTKWPPFHGRQSEMHFHEWKCLHLGWVHISLKFVLKVPIYSKSAMVQIKAWRRTGDKPLSEPTQTKFIEAYRYVQNDMKIVAFTNSDSNTIFLCKVILYKMPVHSPICWNIVSNLCKRYDYSFSLFTHFAYFVSSYLNLSFQNVWPDVQE